MHNPFAVAVQWPDDARRYVIHLQRPYFAAALFETASAAWLTLSWAPASPVDDSVRESLFRSAAQFCRSELGQVGVPIEFIERKHGHHLPRFLMAQGAVSDLFIVEPDHSAPLVEVRESAKTAVPRARQPKLSPRFDVITEWRLEEMRKYYQQFLERQQRLAATNANAPATGK
jgi:hypothetical protein